MRGRSAGSEENGEASGQPDGSERTGSAARKRNRCRTNVRRGVGTMPTGKIKKLVRERGFGFILGSDGAELFFHRSALQGEGFDTLAEGQAVEYDVEKGDKGPRAANMKVAASSD
jgi:CspA family cold shock protein